MASEYDYILVEIDSDSYPKVEEYADQKASVHPSGKGSLVHKFKIKAGEVKRCMLNEYWFWCGKFDGLTTKKAQDKESTRCIKRRRDIYNIGVKEDGTETLLSALQFKPVLRVLGPEEAPAEPEPGIDAMTIKREAFAEFNGQRLTGLANDKLKKMGRPGNLNNLTKDELIEFLVTEKLPGE